MDTFQQKYALEPKGPVPYEAVPQLAANDRFMQLMDRLRELKKVKDELFEERTDSQTGEKLPSVWDELKIEAGALAAVAGADSVAYGDLVLVNVPGGETKGKLTGASLIEQLETRSAVMTDWEKQKAIKAVALAANDCNPNDLVKFGFPPWLVEPARSPGKPRSGSTQISWVGSKGKGGRKRSAGSGGRVQ